MQQERYGRDGKPLNDKFRCHIYQLVNTTLWGQGPSSAFENALWFPIRPGGARKHTEWEGNDELYMDLDLFAGPTHVSRSSYLIFLLNCKNEYQEAGGYKKEIKNNKANYKIGLAAYCPQLQYGSWDKTSREDMGRCSNPRV
jgi:hypothetical protein